MGRKAITTKGGVWVKALRPHDYEQRVLREGDLYQPSSAIADLYERAGVVRRATDSEIAEREGRAATPAPAAPQAKASEIDTLRAEYEARAGIPPSKAWGAKKLRAEIDGLRPVDPPARAEGAAGDQAQASEKPVSEIGGKLL